MTIVELKERFPLVQVLIDQGVDMAVLKDGDSYVPVIVLGDQPLVERFLEDLKDGQYEILMGKESHVVNTELEYICYVKECTHFAATQQIVVGIDYNKVMEIPVSFCMFCGNKLTYVPKMGVT